MSSTNLLTIGCILLLPVLLCLDPEVITKFGKIRGSSKEYLGKQANEFLGIPYAEPPIGEMRFKRPREWKAKWNDTLNAQTMPPGCMQHKPIEMNEDCLFLNIWVPKKRSNVKKLPVMFWIYGGGFYGGSVGEYNGGILSVLTETVVVSVNYRLNVFGFSFGNSDDMPGNMGLYDQRLAMKWVNDNINDFGGDANQVTIFGQSAGSMSVNIHLMSSASWPFFERAQMTSGIAVDYLYVDKPSWALRRTKQFANISGCEDSENSNKISDLTIKCLQNKSAKQLLDASTHPAILDAAPILSPLIPFAWFPVFGTDFIPKPPRDIWKVKQFKPNTSILIGTVYNELPMSPLIEPNQRPSDGMSKLLSKIPQNFMNQRNIEDFSKIHFIGVNEDNDRDSGLQAANQLDANLEFQCPTNVFAEVYSEISSVYQFMFSFKPKNDSVSCDRNYPCHQSDLQFTFGSTSNTRDAKVSRQWMAILKRFAKSGTAAWPPYYRTGNNELVPIYYDFNGKSQLSNTKIGFRYFQCSLWKSMAFDKS